MTSAEIRQSFFDFFASKGHSIVPSASLMPTSPNLLFTNAGMNQFVPYFLGTEKAPLDPPRAADTQKCIRAGGKHNDLEDVGYDTYHHTFFEMLGNWSFGDYFKTEAIIWSWELLTEVWGFPPERLYATVYSPQAGDPAAFDQEAYDLWKVIFEKAGLDPKVHIISGNKQDNFWMMGETGPCGPCSELHVDLTPKGDSKGTLVNQDSDLCIEIWNLVFIQFNANADGSFTDLPAKHVDTGMGFERACSIIQNTQGFTDFSTKPTNYATDIFQPLFRAIEALSQKSYTDIYPEKEAEASEALKEAIAFRVVADHLRTLAFSIADGIMPGNSGRNYVLRRILRRAVKYGRSLGFDGSEPFLPKLVDPLVKELGVVFPEIATRACLVKDTLATEESSFNKTLDRGLQLFEKQCSDGAISGGEAFALYDTYGFPLDLTELLARERGISVDVAAFQDCMEQQRQRARAAQKKTVVKALDLESQIITNFLGFEQDTCEAEILELHQTEEQHLLITDQTVLFTEMGGQEGDRGTLEHTGKNYPILGTQKVGNAIAHIVSNDGEINFKVGDSITLTLDRERRAPIEAHHTATHLLHWALHQHISPNATQQGSSVSIDRLRFDFNSKALEASQITALETAVNTCIQAAEAVTWSEVPHQEIKDRADVMQFFGDKYGDQVRVVKIGGTEDALDGYSMELCGGTHVRNTAEIGLFKIKSEGAIAAGIRRIEACCGDAAKEYLKEQAAQEAKACASQMEKLVKLNITLKELGIDAVEIPRDGNAESLKALVMETDKILKKAQTSAAAVQAKALLESVQTLENGLQVLVTVVDAPDANALRSMAGSLVGQVEDGLIILGANFQGKVGICAQASEAAIAAGHSAGAIIRKLAEELGGKGGGKDNFAMGGAPDTGKLVAVLQGLKLS
ncbi:MAG: Alanine--tRNA ligase [Opitutia bacterium UBA7350]|nr:MAG: Alanine--tRNA ligase [Opitutae bacterium UBA7350]